MEREAIFRAQRDDFILFGREKVDFVETKLSIFKSQIRNPDLPRFVHGDLAISGDSAGLCIGTVDGFVKTPAGGTMPHFWIDGLLEITPPKGGEILLYKFREVILALKELGMNIKWVTFDQYQSTDSMQILRQQGFIVGLQSIDTTTYPYDFTKNALYENRLSMPRHARCEKELASLEKDTKRNKIDHPPHGSKDVSDALAGVVYGLTMRREIWNEFEVPLGEIPPEVSQAIAESKNMKASQGN